jgi:hypothetical protein
MSETQAKDPTVSPEAPHRRHRGLWLAASGAVVLAFLVGSAVGVLVRAAGSVGAGHGWRHAGPLPADPEVAASAPFTAASGAEAPGAASLRSG